jgi:type I restriction enzyme S subunit
LPQIRSLRIPLAPIDEQRRILAQVEELLARVQKSSHHLARVPRILKAFRRSVLAAACSGRLTEDWRGLKSYDRAQWRQVALRDVANLRLGKMLDQAKNMGAPTPYLRNVNVRWFSFELDDVFLMRASQADQKEFNIRDGDLFICEGGEPGRCAVWNHGPTNLIFQKAIHRVRLHSDILPYWLAFNLKKDADSEVLEEYFTGSGIKHMTGRALASYVFNVPSLEEQHEIVRRVEALFKLASKIEGRLVTATKCADNLTQAILARAFRGELVPTEAELARQEGRDYEPAAALLARIRERGEYVSSNDSANGGRVRLCTIHN